MNSTIECFGERRYGQGIKTPWGMAKNLHWKYGEEVNSGGGKILRIVKRRRIVITGMKEPGEL